MAEDLGKQVELQAQLNKILQDRIKIQNDLNSAMGKQVGSAQQLNQAQKENASNQENAAGGFQNITQATDKASKAAQKAQKSAGNFFEEIDDGSVAAVAGISGLVKGFKDIGSGIGAAFGLMKSITKGAFSLAKAVIAIPFQMFQGLVGMANNAAQAGTALRQAFEDVRKEFGELESGPGKNIVQGFRDMQSSSSDLAGTGLSVSRVFGYGPDGMAKMMGAVSDIAKGLGPAINLLGDSFGKNAEKAVMFSKGLGLSGEQMGKLMKDAALSGKSQTDMMTEVGSMSLQMAKKFGLSAKDIGKDIADMKGDFATFGNMSTAEMGAASAYARKLGMDMKDLKGVVDKFDDFEGAADSVSQLNQAFGIQLDTMKMMNAENPAERIDMMRESFFAAGKSIENMTRQEKKLLMAQTGLTESALKNAFAAESQGMSYEDFADAAGDAEENQLSQEEVMLKLANAIEKIAEAGQSFSGIGDAFGKGFMKAMSKDKDMRELMTTIREFLKAVFHFGEKVGKVFLDLMRDTEMFKHMKDLFDPATFRKFFDDIIVTFEKFAKYLIKGEGNPEVIFQEFADKLTGFFGSKEGALSGIGGALMRMGEMLGKAFGAIVGFLWDKISPYLWDLLSEIPGFIWEWSKNNYGKVALAISLMMSYAFAKAAASAVLAVAAKKFAMWVTGQVADATPDAPADGDMGGVESASKGIKGVVEALREISLGDIGKVTLILLAIGAGFAGALVMFGYSIALVARALEGVSWKAMAKTFAVVGIAILATIPLLLAGQLLDKMKSVIPGAILGLLGAAALFAVGMLAYAASIMLLNKLIGNLDLGVFAKQLAGVGLALVATIALGLIGYGFSQILPVFPIMMVGLLAAAVLFTVGMLAYGGAIMLLNKLLGNLDLATFANQLAGVGMAITATIALALVGAGFGAILPLFPIIALGVVAAAAIFAGGMLTYGGAIKLLQKVLGPLDLKTFAIQLAGVGLAVGATIALAGVGAGFSVILPILPLIGLGLVAAAAIFTGGMVLYGKAIQVVNKILSKVNMKAFAEKLKGVGLAVVATLVLAKVGLGMAGLGIVLIPIGLGLVAAAALFTGGMLLFGKAISKVNKSLKIPKDFKEKLDIVGEVMKTTSVMLKIAGQSKVGSVLGMGGPSIDSAAGFFINSGPNMLKMIKMIDTIKIPDPKKTAAVMGIIKDLISAMSSLSELANKTAEMATTAAVVGGGTPGAMINAMSDFFTNIMGTLENTVRSLVRLAQGMSKKDLEKARVVASIIQAIAQVAQAMAPTLKAMATNAMFKTALNFLTGSKGKKTNKDTNEILVGMTGMFDVLEERLPTFVENLVKVMSSAMKGKDPKKVAAQAEALGGIMSAIKTTMEGVADFQKMVSKNDDWKTTTAGAQKEVEALFNTMADMLGPDGSINKMIKGMIALAGELDKATKIDAKGMKQGITILVDIGTKLLPKLSSGLEKMAELEIPDLSEGTGFFGTGTSLKDQVVTAIDNLADLVTKSSSKLTNIKDVSSPFQNLSTVITSMEVILRAFDSNYFGKTGRIANAVTSLSESYNSTYLALSNMASKPADIKTKLQTYADTLGFDKETFTIENEKLNFTINVNVELDTKNLVDTISDKSAMGKRTVQVVGAGG